MVQVKNKFRPVRKPLITGPIRASAVKRSWKIAKETGVEAKAAPKPVSRRRRAQVPVECNEDTDSGDSLDEQDGDDDGAVRRGLTAAEQKKYADNAAFERALLREHKAGERADRAARRAARRERR